MNTNDKTSFKELKSILENEINTNYETFIKALISVEKGINEMEALQELYDDYMANDTLGLLNELFEEKIDELREEGKIKNVGTDIEEDNLINLVGNIVKEPEILERETRDNKAFIVANFSIRTKDKDNKYSTINLSAYGEKSFEVKDFKKDDFIKVFGELRTNTDDKGNEYSNIRVFSTKLLKAKEQMKDSKKPSIREQINKFKAEEKKFASR